MSDDQHNPYESPATISDDKGQARFRLRRWFAAALYLALAADFLIVWSVGLQPFLVSIFLFMATLVLSVALRRHANIRLHESGIQYEDLVQQLDVTWNRITGVVHSQSKTVIATRSPLVQVTIHRRHEHYRAIADKLADLQREFGFEIRDTRTLPQPAANSS